MLIPDAIMFRRKVLESVGITKDEVDLWEINEAFSSMCILYFYFLSSLRPY